MASRNAPTGPIYTVCIAIARRGANKMITLASRTALTDNIVR